MKSPAVDAIRMEVGTQGEFVRSVRARVDPFRTIEVRIVDHPRPWPERRHRPHWSRLLRALARSLTALKEHWR